MSHNNPDSRIPGRAGLGLRRELIPAMQAAPPALDFVELAPENWMDMGGRFHTQLEWAAGRYPLAKTLHAVTHGEPSPAAAAFIAFMTGDEGRTILSGLGHECLGPGSAA